LPLLLAHAPLLLKLVLPLVRNLASDSAAVLFTDVVAVVATCFEELLVHELLTLPLALGDKLTGALLHLLAAALGGALEAVNLVAERLVFISQFLFEALTLCIEMSLRLLQELRVTRVDIGVAYAFIGALLPFSLALRSSQFLRDQ
jgi:hypothetical protein